MAPTRRAIILRRVLIVVALVVVLAAGGFYWWAETPLGPDDTALEALRSGDGVTVSLSDDLAVFVPENDEPHVGLVLYPGGRVDFRSYAPLARDVAELGYFVAVPKMPLNLAVLDSNAAQGIIDDHPDIVAWAVGGHSLGGSMAATFASSNLDEVEALVLLASYPPSNVDLSDTDLLALSAYGTLDGVLSQDRFQEAIPRLPDDTVFQAIEGGNHAQFGSYGPQPGDNDAQISADDQQFESAESIALLLRPIRLQTLTP